jgi:hypothetical protein
MLHLLAAALLKLHALHLKRLEGENEPLQLNVCHAANVRRMARSDRIEGGGHVESKSAAPDCL